KWRESRNINLHCHVALPCEMAATYWGDKYNSLHPDKSIFLDDFYSEAIFVAGKMPAWWLITPDKEVAYEQEMENIRIKDSARYDNLIDFGSIANARPQDYLASTILNLINIRQCPEETWLNILDLCHKLTAHPSLDCTSLHIKEGIYTAQNNSALYQEIYCHVMNNTLDAIYGRENSIIIARTLKVIANRHDNKNNMANIYRILLAHRRDSDAEFTNNDKLSYEFTTATEIIFDLIKQAFIWFLDQLNRIDASILPPDSGLRIVAGNLISHIEHKQDYIPVTNINPVNSTRNYDVCIKHIIEHRNNNWSLIVVDNENQSYEMRQGKTPVELVAWGVLNRLITHETRISVSCPYLSVKQTQIADIATILLRHLPELPNANLSLATFTVDEAPLNDIIIFNELKSNSDKSLNNIEIYRFQVTCYGGVIFDKAMNIDGLLSLFCQGLSADLKAGNKPHKIAMYCISSGSCHSFMNEAKTIYNKICHFVGNLKKGYTHFIDTIDYGFYAIEARNNKLKAITNISARYPEENIKTDNNVLMNFSGDVEDNAVLNYLYRNNIYGYIQLFYKVDGNTSRIYILDEHGQLTRLSQPFYDQQSFINQWIMFLYNSRNRIKSLDDSQHDQPNIEIFELSYNKFDQILKNRLTASGLPGDKPYFDLKISIEGDKGQQTIIFECEDMKFSSRDHGTDIYAALRRYLAKNFKSDSRTPVYLTDVDMPLSQITNSQHKLPCMRDFIMHKINIEKRLNTIINKI
ncbi:MAG: class I adenylate cyclase, partial [Gammaproteobacteria bacterium]|nr:class I adenylate cyclase [Gammaproteobacteria bacterium]